MRAMGLGDTFFVNDVGRCPYPIDGEQRDSRAVILRCEGGDLYVRVDKTGDPRVRGVVTLGQQAGGEVSVVSLSLAALLDVLNAMELEVVGTRVHLPYWN